jgi:hypothetical protein
VDDPSQSTVLPHDHSPGDRTDIEHDWRWKISIRYRAATRIYAAKIDTQIAGRSIEVSAEQLHGTARQHAWRHITSTADRFAKYEQKTDREIPVIRLRTRPH